MLPTDDVYVQMVHALTALLPIVDDRPKACFAQFLLSSNSRSNDHEVTKQFFVPVRGFRKLT